MPTGSGSPSAPAGAAGRQDSSNEQPTPQPGGTHSGPPGDDQAVPGPGAGSGPGPGTGSGPGWGAAPTWATESVAAWQLPDVKPGVIPLRPLGVGEILDGAVTTIRRNLGAMLGLSAVVAAVTQLLAAGSLLWIFGDQVLEPNFGLTEDFERLENLATGVPAALLGVFISLIATVFLTGVLTVVVGQAVLGRKLTITQAWRDSKGRLPRLLGLTFVYTLIWLSPFVALFLLAALASVGGSGLLAVVLILGGFASIPVVIWLYVRYALSLPSLMLESTTTSDGGSRPVTIRGSLHRSAVLVRSSWWRVFGILLLITFISWLIGQVVAVPFGVTSLLGGSDFGGSTATWLILNTLAGMVGATITAPFSAAAIALLYVDQRIRREGLDIELARVAGVELPGSPGSGGSSPGPP